MNIAQQDFELMRKFYRGSVVTEIYRLQVIRLRSLGILERFDLCETSRGIYVPTTKLTSKGYEVYRKERRRRIQS